jgi:hypothetical protein
LIWPSLSLGRGNAGIGIHLKKCVVAVVSVDLLDPKEIGYPRFETGICAARHSLPRDLR